MKLYKIIAKTLLLIGKVLRSPKGEVLTLSNLFNSKVQREVRKAFTYKTNYYLEVTKND